MLNAIITAKALVAYITGVVGDPQRRIRQLEGEIQILSQQLQKTSAREISLSEMVQRMQGASPYPIDPKDSRLKRFDAKERYLFQEALLCYSVGAYTLLCCSMRTYFGKLSADGL